MTSLQIRSVPDDVHKRLRIKAARAGQSLSEYALTVLSRDARTLSPGELLERAAERGAGSATTQDVIDALHAERDTRS